MKPWEGAKLSKVDMYGKGLEEVQLSQKLGI